MTNGIHKERFSNKFDYSKEESELFKSEDFSGLDNGKNKLLINFQSLVYSYVQSLIEFKSSKLAKFKQEVLKIESNANCLNLISLVSNLNGACLNDKIKNFINYKRKLEDHLNKLTMQLKEEKVRTDKFSQKSPIDLNKLNLDKLNLEKLNKLEDNEEDTSKFLFLL